MRGRRPALAGEGDEVVMPVIIATGSGKAVIKPAAFQIFARRLADIGLWRVVVALDVELTGICQLMPGLKMLARAKTDQPDYPVVTEAILLESPSPPCAARPAIWMRVLSPPAAPRRR